MEIQTTRKTQWMCFSHINGHGHQKERSDLRNTGSGAIQTLWANGMGLGWFGAKTVSNAGDQLA